MRKPLELKTGSVKELTELFDDIYGRHLNRITDIVYVDGTPPDDGLYITEDQVGALIDGVWRSIIDLRGQVQLLDPTGVTHFDWDGTNLIITGTITAAAGNIGGWNIGVTTLYSDSNEIVLDSSNLKITINDATFGNQGIQLDYNSGTPRLYAGDGLNQFFKFDGTDISWKGTNTELTAAGAFTASNATITGTITATAGAIGGWDIAAGSISIGTTNIVLDSSSKIISIGTSVFGNQGIQLDYNGGAPRAYIGDGSNKYFSFDGTDISWKGVNTELTTAGAFTASNATITGTITASAGAIGGWSISATTLASSNIIIDSSNEKITINSTVFGQAGIQLDYNGGTPRGYIGDGSNQFFKFDGTNISFQGTNASLTTGGVFTASNAVLTGSITATSGNIGGWTIGAGSLYDSTYIELNSSARYIAIQDPVYGNAGIQLQYNAGTPRAYIGDGANAYFQFDGTKVQWKGSNSELDSSGNIICTGGEIGGWTLAATTLTSANITLDSGNDKITVNTITIDGANNRIRSSNYVTGYAGAGFTLEPSLLEVGNAAIRGVLRSAVFQKDVVHVVGGNLLIRPADVLATDMTAADASTLTVEGNETFTNDDILRIKDGIDDEWLLVTDDTSAPTYTVTRDLNTQYPSGENPAWTKGISVTNYGPSGEGGIYLTSSESNAPHVSIFQHGGSPWTDVGKLLQLGNLNGFLDYSSETYGIGIGNETHFFKYDLAQGVRIAGAVDIIGNSTFKGQISISSTGSIRSNTTGNYPYLEFSNSGLQLKTMDDGGTYGTAEYGTDAYGFGATVWLMNAHYQIPWFETKEPQDDSTNDMPSIRLYNRSADPAGGTYQTGDLAVVNGKLMIYTGGAWTVVGTQS